MSLTSPLSPVQKTVWGLIQSGLSPRQIAEKLKSSRQYVHQVAGTAEAKISETMLGAAQSANLQIKMIDAKKGVLLGYDPIGASKVIITYTNKCGVRIWHWYERIEDIKDLSQINEIRAYLMNEAEERGIKLTAEEKKMHPAKLADIIFSRLIPGLGS